jgi:hypothetical protein
MYPPPFLDSALQPYHPHPRSRGVCLPAVPYYPNHHPRRTFVLNENALYSYLPDFTAKYFRNPNSSVDAIISNYILSNPEINQQYWNPVSSEVLRDVFYTIFDAVANAQSGEVVYSTSRRLLRELEDCFREDEHAVLLSGSRVSRHSQHMFRSLAEISHSARSPHIGSVLCTFFLDHVRTFALRDSARSLVQWCHAIIRAYMPEENKRKCMERLLDVRPDLIEELDDEPGAKAQKVANYLEDIEDDRVPRARSRRRHQWNEADDRVGRLVLNEDDERYVRQLREQLREDARAYEDAAERKREQVLRLDMEGRVSSKGHRLTDYEHSEDLVRVPVRSTSPDWEF